MSAASRSSTAKQVVIPRHIEVKGRAKDASTITVTRNEILYGLNQSDKFLLAVVLVDGDRLRRSALRAQAVHQRARLGGQQHQPRPGCSCSHEPNGPHTED